MAIFQLKPIVHRPEPFGNLHLLLQKEDLYFHKGSIIHTVPIEILFEAIHQSWQLKMYALF